jgi:hypothetical protein
MCNQNIISNKFDLKLVTTFSSYMDDEGNPPTCLRWIVNVAYIWGGLCCINIGEVPCLLDIGGTR